MPERRKRLTTSIIIRQLTARPSPGVEGARVRRIVMDQPARAMIPGTAMKRSAQPHLSSEGQQALDQYSHYLHHDQDLSADTRRNYLSNLRQFAAWCEASWTGGQEFPHVFTPSVVATR